jgi:hypothetical protein
VLVVCAAAALFVVGAAAGPAGQGAFAECEEAVARAPAQYDSYLCYYRAGARGGSLEQAAVRLERLREEGRGGGWPLLVRAHVAAARREDAEATEALYREAARRLGAAGQTLGEVIAYTNLRRLRLTQGDRAGADIQVEAALRAAQRGGDREALVRASVLEASHLTDMGEDLGRAHRALIRAEAAAFPDGPAGLQQSVLRHFANVSYELGRYEEAIEKLDRLLALSQALGDRSNLAALRYNIVNTRRAQREERPVAGSEAELRRLAEQALETAQEQPDRVVATRAHALLAELLAREDPTGAEEHARRCREGARELAGHLAEMECLTATAKHLAAARPATARRAMDQAVQIALAGDNDLYVAQVWQARLRAAWDLSPPAEAARESLRALEAVERLRAAQGDPEARIHILRNWTKDYYWLAGRLLSAEPPDLDLAFTVIERMRARVLLEALDAAGLGGARSLPPPPGAAEARARIVAVQRRLLQPTLDPSTRKALLAELQQREVEEADLRARYGTDGARGAPPLSRQVTLEDVGAGLRADEALILFLLGLDRDVYGGFGGGAWAVAVTRSGSAVWRIPDRMRLETTVPIFAGLLARRDGSEATAAVALHRELLGGGAALLGAGVRRVVIVPDGILHELPFAALRATPDQDPLGARYEIALVPSATVWARWQSRPDSRAPAAALVFADPRRTAARAAPAVERGGVLAQALELGPLPHARLEGRRVRRAVGGGSRLLAGPEATEAALKSLSLSGYGILHFATHAVADEAYPDRSAVLLEPGSDAEDGLLQPREVSSLDLAGRAVVLSACRTAAGPVASGEGVLSLARSFFEGGARTVVASRWRLRDDEAERLFGSFYDYLGRGHGVGESLRLARVRSIAEGMPAATWASVELLGDAALALSARPPARLPGPLRALLVLAALGILVWSVRTARALSRQAAG